jgi:hypothetical protein
VWKPGIDPSKEYSEETGHPASWRPCIICGLKRCSCSRLERIENDIRKEGETQIIRNKIEEHRENWVNYQETLSDGKIPNIFYSVNKKDLQTERDLGKDGILVGTSIIACTMKLRRRNIPTFSGISKNTWFKQEEIYCKIKLI